MKKLFSILIPASTVLSGIGSKDSYRETKASVRRQPNEKKPFLFRLERLSSDRKHFFIYFL